MEKKVYTIRGSEDGIIGVYTNMKRAWLSATSYCTIDGYTPAISVYKDSTCKGFKEIKATYQNVCKELNRGYPVSIDASDMDSEYPSKWCSAEIEMFWLND